MLYLESFVKVYLILQIKSDKLILNKVAIA